jgi:hypothetical protein
MSTIETYKQEIETELELVHEKLVELKATIRGFSDVERLEKMANDMMTKIRELNVEMEDSWEQIKGDIDSSRNKINEAFARINRSLVI